MITKNKLIAIIGGAILTAGIMGYQIGKNEYKPTNISNLNANQNGPKVISINTNSPTKQFTFYETENGEYIPWKEFIKCGENE